MSIVRLSVAFGVALLLGLQRSAPRELDARQILERTAKVYAECKTYRDSGVVNTLFIKEGRNRTVRKPFTTAFVRPDRFRYEFEDRRGEEEFDRYLVWRNGQDVRTWWDVRPGVEENTTLEEALVAARGVSDASSYTIADLLLDFTRGFQRATDPRNAARKADEELEGSRCFVIASGTPDEPRTLWIDQKTFLLRRLDEQNTLEEFRTEETTTYEPVLDGEIPEALLVFDPSEPAQDSVGFASARRFQGWAPEEPDAPEILARMAKVYADCKTYRDSGVVQSVSFEEVRGKRTARMPFTTAFVRPDRFRYEVKARRGEEEFDRCLVWRKDQDVRTWWDVAPGIGSGRLSSALSAAWVVSDCSARLIPALLLPKEVLDVRVTSLPDPERLQDEELDASACFVIQGKWLGRSMTLWIDQKNSLLRRTLTQGASRTETTTTYEPVLDAEIPEALLIFDPPVLEERR